MGLVVILPAALPVCISFINNTMVGKYIYFGYFNEGPGRQNKTITVAHMHTLHVCMLATALMWAMRCIM